MVNLNLRSPQTASSLGEMQTVRNLLNRNFQRLWSKASLSNVAQQAGLAVGIDSRGAGCLCGEFCEATDCLSVNHRYLLLSWMLILKLNLNPYETTF